MLIDFNTLPDDELKSRIDKIKIWLFDNIADYRYYDGETALWKAQTILEWREKAKKDIFMKQVMESIL